MPENFEVWLLQTGRGQARLDALVEQVDWDDAGPILTGSLRLRSQTVSSDFSIREGDRILLKARDTDGRVKEWWRMQIVTPDADYMSGTRSFALANDLWRLRDSKAEFKFVTSKKQKPNGWPVHEVIAFVCKLYGIPTAPIPKMKARLAKYGPKTTSPLAVIDRCLDLERTNHGAHYVYAFEHGRLVVRARARSERMLLLGELLTQAGMSSTLKENFATALLMRAVVAKSSGKDAQSHDKKTVTKLNVLVRATNTIKKYGLVTQMGFATASSQQELVEKGRRHLSYLAQPKREIRASHPGIVGLRRADAIRMEVHADQDVFDRVLFVQEVRYQLGAGRFDMDLVLGVEDPWVPETPKVFATIEEVAVKRGRKVKTKPRPKKAGTRGNKRGPSKTAKRPAPKLGGVVTPVR